MAIRKLSGFTRTLVTIGSSDRGRDTVLVRDAQVLERIRESAARLHWP